MLITIEEYFWWCRLYGG